MKTEHTPGPWTLETVPTSIGSCHKIGPFPSNGVHGETHACVYADNVNIGEELYNKTGGELLANARLIAAAPALVEALRELEEVARRYNHLAWKDVPTGINAALHQAMDRAALALLDTCEACHGTEMTENGDDPCPKCCFPREVLK